MIVCSDEQGLVVTLFNVTGCFEQGQKGGPTQKGEEGARERGKQKKRGRGKRLSRFYKKNTIFSNLHKILIYDDQSLEARG